MARVALTKNELKKQRDSLKLFERYLPTLQLKKQQLQAVVRRVGEQISEKQSAWDARLEEISEWVGVLGETINLESLVGEPRISVDRGSVAGIEIPVFRSVEFEAAQYDLFTTPLWVDTVVETIRNLTSRSVEIAVLRREFDLLSEELAITTQRVNLFEKVKIPEARDHIRRIQISLGDQQTAAVVRGKISKKKLMQERVELAD